MNTKEEQKVNTEAEISQNTVEEPADERDIVLDEPRNFQRVTTFEEVWNNIGPEVQKIQERQKQKRRHGTFWKTYALPIAAAIIVVAALAIILPLTLGRTTDIIVLQNLEFREVTASEFDEKLSAAEIKAVDFHSVSVDEYSLLEEKNSKSVHGGAIRFTDIQGTAGHKYTVEFYEKRVKIDEAKYKKVTEEKVINGVTVQYGTTVSNNNYQTFATVSKDDVNYLIDYVSADQNGFDDFLITLFG